MGKDSEFDNFCERAQEFMGGAPLCKQFLTEIWEGADKNLERAINHVLSTPDEKVRRAGQGGGGGGGGGGESKSSKKDKEKEKKSKKKDKSPAKSSKSDVSPAADFPDFPTSGFFDTAPGGMGGMGGFDSAPAGMGGMGGFDSAPAGMGGMAGMAGMGQAFGQQPPAQPAQTWGQPQAMPPQTMPPQGMPPQTMPPQGMPPQSMPPQGMPPQTMPPQGMPPQGMPPQTMPPQGMPPHGMPHTTMPPHGVPDAGQPGFGQASPSFGANAPGAYGQPPPAQTWGQSAPQYPSQMGHGGDALGAVGHPQFGTVESSQYHSQMGAGAPPGNLGAYGDMGQAKPGFGQASPGYGGGASFAPATPTTAGGWDSESDSDNDWWNNPAPLQSQRGGGSHGGDALGPAAPSQFATLESASQYPTQMGTGAPGYGGAYGDMGQGHGHGHDQWAQQGGGGYGAYGSQSAAPQAMGGHDQWSQQGGYGAQHAQFGSAPPVANWGY